MYHTFMLIIKLGAALLQASVSKGPIKDNQNHPENTSEVTPLRKVVILETLNVTSSKTKFDNLRED